MKAIRIVSESGNVDSVVSRFNDIIEELPHINFKFAEIHQCLSKMPNDKNNPNFYPLRLYSNDGLTFFISEVRCGYRGHSCDCMIEILKSAGFSLSQKVIDTIYNKPNLQITIWKEEGIQQF